MIITDEKLDAFMVCWADWCCRGCNGDIKGYPRSAAFTHEKIDMEFGATLLTGDTSDLEEIESYVSAFSIDHPEEAIALRAHYEAEPKWQNLQVNKKCRRLRISDRRFRERVSKAKAAIKTAMQLNKFHSRMLA